SPAAEAGIRRGDIITEFNGKEISDYSLYYDYLKECTPGQKVKIKYYRSGRTQETSVTVAADSSSR
ncbi:MAG: PDZ domain-containing protein, partial [Clostridia bacterium]|nr:PDZ domain-containing protein [Clostridia bacterium]